MTALDDTFAALSSRLDAHAAKPSTQPAPKPVAPTKNDLTTAAAKEIIDGETASRSANVARLKAARLERDRTAD